MDTLGILKSAIYKSKAISSFSSSDNSFIYKVSLKRFSICDFVTFICVTNLFAISSSQVYFSNNSFLGWYTSLGATPSNFSFATWTAEPKIISFAILTDAVAFVTPSMCTELVWSFDVPTFILFFKDLPLYCFKKVTKDSIPSPDTNTGSSCSKTLISKKFPSKSMLTSKFIFPPEKPAIGA